MKNLAEAVGARQDRPRAAALRESLTIERQAIEIARQARASFLGELLGNHAYGLTLLAKAHEVPQDEREACLEEAGKLFEEALRITTDPAIRRVIENNRLIWRSFVAPEGDRDEHIAALRAHFRGLDPRLMQRDWAMAAHNLANELIEQHRNLDDLREALDLLRRALPLRPIDAEPLFHWETAGLLGELLASLYEARRRLNLASFRLTFVSARSQAVDHLRLALRAARSFGPGLFMTRTARYLGMLAADVDPGDIPDLALAGEALIAIEEVLAEPEDAPPLPGGAEGIAHIARAWIRLPGRDNRHRDCGHPIGWMCCDLSRRLCDEAVDGWKHAQRRLLPKAGPAVRPGPTTPPDEAAIRNAENTAIMNLVRQGVDFDEALRLGRAEGAKRRAALALAAPSLTTPAAAEPREQLVEPAGRAPPE